jgi:hypothetical protein
MSRRRKRRSTSKPWLWVLGALAVAVVAYLFFRHPRGSAAIPVPGEAARWVETPLSPREEIRDSDREALDRVLRERSRPR